MEHFFDSREAASIAAADRLADALQRRLDVQAEASLVVSGGTTPARCLEALSSVPLEWQRIHVLLSDERWVPGDDPDSNEAMIRKTLLHRPGRYPHPGGLQPGRAVARPRRRPRAGLHPHRRADRKSPESHVYCGC